MSALSSRRPFGLRRKAGQHVLQDGHLAEQLGGLEGAGDAEPGDAMRGKPGDDPGRRGCTQALRRPVVAGQDVEQNGLAGAVGADERMDGAGLDREADAVERSHAAERHVDAVERPASGRRCTRLARPRRRLIGAHRPRSIECSVDSPAGRASRRNSVPTMPSGSA